MLSGYDDALDKYVLIDINPFFNMKHSVAPVLCYYEDVNSIISVFFIPYTETMIVKFLALINYLRSQEIANLF